MYLLVYVTRNGILVIYETNRCTGRLKKKFNNCLEKKLLYSQLSGGIDNYRASYPLKYYHTTKRLGERLLYSQFKGTYYYIAHFHDRTYCLEKRLLYSQLSGDRQLYSHLSIEILPYSQLSGGKVTI